MIFKLNDPFSYSFRRPSPAQPQATWRNRIQSIRQRIREYFRALGMTASYNPHSTKLSNATS